jgi:hypothetical protein
MSPHRVLRRGEAGFVLIGVVIFVLALTIIGLSLFSLSSYEAQFLQRSIDREQAFQSAQGGVERAKFLLSARDSMARVSADLLDPVVSATAVQVQGGLPDSIGAIEWQGADVTLRVTARVNGEERTIGGQFKPRLTRNVYSQLIATAGGIVVEDFAEAGATPTDRRYTVHLSGPIWQGTMPPDTNAWLSLLGPAPPPLPVGIATDPVALPAATAYVASHVGSASLPLGPDSRQYFGIDWWRYRLYPGTGNIGFFRSPASDPDFSLYDKQTHDGTMLRVRGCAIWLMPRGVRFDGKVTVVGRSAPGADCLVIVAGRSGSFADDPDAGIWFFGGLESTIPVILISDGRVYIQYMNNYGSSGAVSELSIYARDVVLTGPRRALGGRMDLAHPWAGYLDNYWVPRLANSGFLPNVTSANGRELALQPGTWRAYP